MKHIKRISTVRAEAYGDFLNAVWRAFQDLLVAKKVGLI
jgi:hypothetical protein